MFNCPFDNQAYIRIRLESEAKLYIQDKIKPEDIELIGSNILEFENLQNQRDETRIAICKCNPFSSPTSFPKIPVFFTNLIIHIPF